jgi:hypothetical protein
VRWFSLYVFLINRQSGHDTAQNKEKQSVPRLIFSETKTRISTGIVFQVKAAA